MQKHITSSGLSITRKKLFGVGFITLSLLGLLAFGVSNGFLGNNSAHADSINTTDFVTTWSTDGNGTTNESPTSITLPIFTNNGTYDVDWNNDGIYDDVNLNQPIAHDYNVSGTYKARVKFSDQAEPRMVLAIYGENLNDIGKKFLDVNQWGSARWRQMDSMFFNAVNLTDFSANDVPDTSLVETTQEMFSGAVKFNSDISNWDLSNVTTFKRMFYNANTFNQPLNNWNVSNVTDMGQMFYGASAFNQPLNNWNVSNVTDMNYMFSNAEKFNGSVSAWDISAVRNVQAMFYSAKAFNQPLNNWNVSSVTDMNQMFYDAKVFNQPLNNWNVSNVTDMNRMFSNAKAFNQPLNDWDVSGVTNMLYMFSQASLFNQPLNDWDVSNVMSMYQMFSYATAFNGDISDWDVSNVTIMDQMFFKASSFNQSLNSWDISNVTNMSYMFNDASAFNQPLNNWDVSRVTNMSYMFSGAAAFNQPLNNWDVSSVTTMDAMFTGTAFNQSIGNWQVPNLTTAVSMLNNDTYSTASYDALLKGWSDQSLQDNVTFSASNTGFCTSASERQAIVDTYNWTINDKGLDCGSIGLQGERIVYSGVSASEIGSLYPASNSFEPAAANPYSLECENNYPDNQFFSITGNRLSSNTLLSLETPQDQDQNNIYNLCIKVTRDDGITFEDMNFSISVSYAPYNTVLSNSYVFENQPIGTTIATLDTTPGFALSSANPYSLSCQNPGVDDQYFSMVGTSLKTATVLHYGSPVDTNQDNIYDICVRATNQSGVTYDQRLEIYINQEPQSAHINNVELAMISNGKKILKIEGAALIGDSQEIDIQLNDHRLPICADNTGYSAEQLRELFGDALDAYGDISDGMPCYYVLSQPEQEGFGPTLSDETIKILLPSNFNLGSEGTVQINNSNTFTFNPGQSGGNITPTLNANGDKPVTETPTIPSRPTFSGVATPGAEVVVTVRSDPITCSATADSSGNWSCTLPTDLPAGRHSVTVQITNPDGSVVNLGPYTVIVAANGTSSPVTNNSPLAPNTGFMKVLQEYKAAQAKKQPNHLIVLVGATAAITVIAGTAIITIKKRHHKLQFNQ